MKSINWLLLGSWLLLAPLYANTIQGIYPSDKDCGTLANACLNAGFDRSFDHDKNIWLNCMKPILLGRQVDKVTIDNSVAKGCKTAKIKELKEELNEFQK